MAGMRSAKRQELTSNHRKPDAQSGGGQYDEDCSNAQVLCKLGIQACVIGACQACISSWCRCRRCLGSHGCCSACQSCHLQETHHNAVRESLVRQCKASDNLCRRNLKEVPSPSAMLHTSLQFRAPLRMFDIPHGISASRSKS